MAENSLPQIKKKRKIRVNLATLILIPMSLVALLPFIWMILGSFKTGAEIRQIPPTFFPQTFTLDNYRKVLTDPQLPLGLFYRNSAIIAVANVIQVLFTSSLLG